MPRPTALESAVERAAAWLGGARCGALAGGAVVGSAVGALALLLWPADAGPLGAYAAAFRAWCFEAHATTGAVDAGAVASKVVIPLVLLASVWLAWGDVLRVGWRRARRTVLRWAAVAALVGLLLPVGAIAGLGAPELEPPTLSSLRIDIPLPDFELVDQEGRMLRSRDLRGKVAVVTSIYARCRHTCPLIVGELADVLAGLPDAVRRRVVAVPISMDPANDTPSVLAKVAAEHRASAPLWRFATGEPEAVGRLLDHLGFERRPVGGGQIAHVAQFLVVTPQGHIAWRVPLGQPDMLRDAIEALAGAPSSAALSAR